MRKVCMTFYRMRYCCLNNGPRTGILVFDPLSKSYNFQTVAFYYFVYLLATVTSYCRTQIQKNCRGDATGPCYQIIRVRQVMARPFLRKTIGDQGLLPLADFLHWLLQPSSQEKGKRIEQNTEDLSYLILLLKRQLLRK